MTSDKPHLAKGVAARWNMGEWDSQAFMYLLKFCIRRQGHDAQAF